MICIFIYFKITLALSGLIIEQKTILKQHIIVLDHLLRHRRNETDVEGEKTGSQDVDDDL